MIAILNWLSECCPFIDPSMEEPSSMNPLQAKKLALETLIIPPNPTERYEPREVKPGQFFYKRAVEKVEQERSTQTKKCHACGRSNIKDRHFCYKNPPTKEQHLDFINRRTMKQD